MNTKIEASHPHQIEEGMWVFRYHGLYIYLIQGERKSAVIEVGVSATVDNLARHLINLVTSPDYLVVMHPHPDHLTGLFGLQEYFPNAHVIMGSGAPQFIAHPKVTKAIIDEDKYISEYLRREGYEIGRPPIEAIADVKRCLTKSEGDTVSLGGLTLRFMSVPGHSIGDLAVCIPERRILFSSDSLGGTVGDMIFPGFLTSYNDYMATIRRLEALQPVILCLAHSGYFCGQDAITTRFQQARRASERLYNKVRGDTRDEKTIINELFEAYYHDEFKLCSPENVANCFRRVIKISREAKVS